MRSLNSALFGAFAALTLITTPVGAGADTIEAEPAKTLKIEDVKLPTEADIEEMIEKLPNFNAIMGGMMDIVQDEDIHNSVKDAADNFSQSIEKSGLKDMTKNLDKGELPDINKMFATLLRLTADDEVLGDMLDVVSKLQKSVEDNLDEEMFKPEPRD